MRYLKLGCWLTVCALGSGCASWQKIAAGLKGRDEPAVVAGVFDGPACGPFQPTGSRSKAQPQFRRSYDREQGGYVFRGPRQPDAPVEEQVLGLICAHQSTGEGALVTTHNQFDDRRFDHLQAALLVADCAQNPKCEKIVLGMMQWYAETVDPAEVHAQLKQTSLSPAAQQFFGQRVDAARAEVKQRVAAMDPRRQQMYVTVPNRVRAERLAYFQKYAPLYTQLDPLLAQCAEAVASRQVPDELIDNLRAVRESYFTQCHGESCRYDPLVVSVTRRLVLLHVIQNDALAALVENVLLKDNRARTSSYANQLLAAEMAATKAEAEAWKKYDRLERQGADAATLTAMFGDPPPAHVSPDAPWFVWGRGLRHPDLAATVSRDNVINASGQVLTVKRRGDWATIKFADVITEYHDADCHETDKFDHITPEGKIVYRQICRNHRTVTKRHPVEPLTVPAAEAKKLARGEYVDALIHKTDRKGYVVAVRHKKDVVQVRAHRLRP